LKRLYLINYLEGVKLGDNTAVFNITNCNIYLKQPIHVLRPVNGFLYLLQHDCQLINCSTFELFNDFFEIKYKTRIISITTINSKLNI
jgi:hypothetical protein